MWIFIFGANTDDVYDMLGCQPEHESEHETEPESEHESEHESEPESEPDSNIRDYFVVCPSEKLRSIPHGIFEQTAWHALTIKLDGLEITPQQIKNVSDCCGIKATQLYPECISVDYDTHLDCYCKTEDVCGCGCDTLHNGW